MVPMRSVPHRVVCLLGLDDGVFPRAGAVDGDDVLAARPGDRRARRAQRGPSAAARRDRSPRPSTWWSPTPAPTSTTASRGRRPFRSASCSTRSTTTARRGPRTHAVRRHPLQPFDRAQLRAAGSTGRSASTGRRWPARRAAARAPARAAVPRRPLPAPARGDVELADLVAFLRHPVGGSCAAGSTSRSPRRATRPTTHAGRARRAASSGRSATGCCATCSPAGPADDRSTRRAARRTAAGPARLAPGAKIVDQAGPVARARRVGDPAAGAAPTRRRRRRPRRRPPAGRHGRRRCAADRIVRVELLPARRPGTGSRPG